MMISLSFSAVIYNMLIREVDRFARIQRIRIDSGAIILPGPPLIDESVFEEARSRILINILAANGTILIISGGLGYFLAGKTLNPIQEMMDEQNRFISDASHELRTPLTALKSSMEVYLRDKQQTLPDARELITGGLEEVNQMQVLSDSMLRLTQYQKPQEHLKIQRFPISTAVNDAIKKIEPMAKVKNISIKDNSSNGEMTGYKNAVTELITILLDNAVKYSPEKSTVTVTSEKRDGTAKIEVKDEGIGIRKEDIPHLFDRFFRADTARSKSETSGYGLGLAIAKKIVDNHHGSIAVKSEEGKGSSFTVIFQNRG